MAAPKKPEPPTPSAVISITYKKHNHVHSMKGKALLYKKATAKAVATELLFVFVVLILVVFILVVILIFVLVIIVVFVLIVVLILVLVVIVIFKH